MIPALSISNLTKTYRNGVVALRGIDLEVAPGDFFALLGPNGAGKSTAIGIITSLVNKSAGSVAIFGHDLENHGAAAKPFLGLVPQEFNFNVFEPVIEILVNQAGYYGMDRRTAYQQAESYLKKLGLWNQRRTRARDLSGGMKRRLMIARALVHEPKLLILDEPTAGVDIELRRSMWDFLTELNARGTTIILTTHYLEEAEHLCRNIAIIDHGIIIENTSMKELLKTLQLETFILYLRNSLASLPELPGHEIRSVDDNTLEVDISRGTALNQLFADLARHDIDVVSMRNKSNRLEELFMRLISPKEGAPPR